MLHRIMNGGCAQEVGALKSLCRGRAPGCRERLCSVRATWVGLNSARLTLSLRTLLRDIFGSA